MVTPVILLNAQSWPTLRIKSGLPVTAYGLADVVAGPRLTSRLSAPGSWLSPPGLPTAGTASGTVSTQSFTLTLPSFFFLPDFFSLPSGLCPTVTSSERPPNHPL